jgi:small subunit ribosomal protein S13
MQHGSGYRGLNIRGARVGGVEIPNSKRIETALQYIHGVGSTTARQILLDIGLENKLARELTEEDLTSLRDEVSKYMVEGDLVRKEPHCLWSPALLHSRFLHLGFRVYQVL